MANKKIDLYQISETEWISECGEWEISTKTGRPRVYNLGENIDMEIVDVPDEVQELYDELQGK